MLDNCLVIWGQEGWVVYNMAGQEKGRQAVKDMHHQRNAALLLFMLNPGNWTEHFNNKFVIK